MSNASTNNRGNSVSGAKSIFFFDAALLIELAASPSNHIIRFQAPIAYILDYYVFMPSRFAYSCPWLLLKFEWWHPQRFSEFCC